MAKTATRIALTSSIGYLRDSTHLAGRSAITLLSAPF